MIAQPIEAPRTLALLAGTSPLARPAFTIAAPEPGHPRRARLIGRERELALLTALVDHAPETGSALLIRGAPGAGKSALVGALVAELPDRPVAVLRASGIRAEANLPYAGLHQLLRPVLGELRSLPRPQRRAIEAAFGMAASPAPDPFLIAIATLDLLSMAARPSLVVVVEDAQWLDRRTSEVLSFVARRLSSDRIALLVTVRDDRRSPILDAGLAELRLEALDDDEAGRLLATVAPGIAEPVQERLIHIASGNPLALVELPAALTSEQLTGYAPLPETIPLTARLASAVAGRMRELPVVTRRLLDLLVLDDGGEVADLLAAYATLHPDEPATRDALQPAVAAGIVVVHEETATFRDHLVRAAVHPGIDIAGRRSAHPAPAAASADEEPAIRPEVASPAGPDEQVARLQLRREPWVAEIADGVVATDLVRLAEAAWNDIHLGRWTEAASEIEASAELARETGQTMWSVVADVAGALLAAMRGDEDQVERALARVGPAAIGRGDGWVASTVEVVRGINELSAGRPELAFIRLHECIGSSASEAPWFIDHFADAAVLSGRLDEGRTVFEASGGQGDASRGPLDVAAHVYAGAVLADDGTADERHGLANDDLADWPIHQARLQLHRGRWLRRHRRVADSRAPLRAARDTFDALGAAPLAERARRELRASGERIRRREITAWDQLSPQESEIAHLAAEGLSNREIGGQLFLSHRTVGAHLYRIFPKLGVTSRAQLHRALATTDSNGIVDVQPHV